MCYLISWHTHAYPASSKEDKLLVFFLKKKDLKIYFFIFQWPFGPFGCSILDTEGIRIVIFHT